MKWSKILANNFLINTHSDWQDLLKEALDGVDKNYLEELYKDSLWLPGLQKLLAAFNRPLNHTKYILLGESPYPRLASANGHAFWDEAVQGLWSKTGFSKEVNRATSLRNWLKMLLVARGDLHHDCSQAAIAALDKTPYWQTANQFFNGLLHKGFLLLNASLVYSENKVPYHAKQWRPFLHCLFSRLAQTNPSIQFILLGRIAGQVPEASFFPCLIAEHPYNLSFIHNQKVLAFFKPLDLLACHD